MPLKLALWQTEGHLAEPSANVAALAKAAHAAAAGGAQILLSPECWLQGYNVPDHCVDLAEASNGPSATRIAGIAKENGIAIVYGYAERDPASGAVYNSVQAIGPDGAFFANYRKTHLFSDFERGLYRPGDGFAPPFEFLGWKIGLLICYDVEFPETVRSIALAGADL
ncbi:MAG TPA: nitrilase-related carbon-nitrogen hydrolase, partial [Acidiphilium sp.]